MTNLKNYIYNESNYYYGPLWSDSIGKHEFNPAWNDIKFIYNNVYRMEEYFDRII